MTTSSSIAMTIKCCADCPFFGGLPLISALAQAFSGPEGSLAKAGTCNFDRDTGTLIEIRLGLVGPEREAMLKQAARRLPVADRTTIPEKCPLRSADVVVSLGS